MLITGRRVEYRAGGRVGRRVERRVERIVEDNRENRKGESDGARTMRGEEYGIPYANDPVSYVVTLLAGTSLDLQVVYRS